LPELTNNPDILFINPENSIKIKQIRNLKKTLSRKPVSLPFQAAILINAELTTLPAQHALLKILEEPGKNTFLFLVTPNPQSLLPTIRSRCQIIYFKIDKPRVRLEKEKKILKLIKELQKSTPGQRLKLIELYEKSREKAIGLLKDTIYIVHGQIHSSGSKVDPTMQSPSSKGSSHARPHAKSVLGGCQDGPCRNLNLAELKKNLTLTHQALLDLEANINTKLALDNWALTL